MHTKVSGKQAFQWLGFGAGLAAAAYGTYAGVAWLGYGRAPRPARQEADALLDRFMPAYDVVERHHVDVVAPAEITFAAACEMDMEKSSIVRAIFRGREILLGSQPRETAFPAPLVAQMKTLGWSVLAEIPGREIVMGAVTKPWVADVIFHPLPPDRFEAFREPGFVKIAWTLRADPAGQRQSIFRTETRAVATDAEARSKFRLYWSFLSPGVVLIRRLLLGSLKSEAERRALEVQRQQLAAEFECAR